MRVSSGLLKRVLLIEVAGTEVLGLHVVVTQSEARGQVGEVPAAESWVWHPGPPFGRWILKLRSEPASTFPSLLGPYAPSSSSAAHLGVQSFWSHWFILLGDPSASRCGHVYSACHNNVLPSACPDRTESTPLPSGRHGKVRNRTPQQLSGPR